MNFPVSNGISNGLVKYIIDNKLQSTMNVTSSGSLKTDRTVDCLLRGVTFYTESSSSYGQWILFKFTKKIFDFRGYSLMSNTYYEQPQSWKFEVSPDSIYWVLASSKSGETTLTPGRLYTTQTFKRVKYIKLTQTGYGGNLTRSYSYMQIVRIDFFGRLYNQAVCSCKSHYSHLRLTLMSYLIITCS